MKTTTLPDLVRLSEVEPERVEWLWPARIPRGRMTILDGDPGLGKSALTIELAARISTGSRMPDGSIGLTEPRGVVFLSAEDGLADTIRPRLDAAGANPDEVAALRYVRDDEGRRRLPSVADIGDIEAAIYTMDAALLVVDPLVAYLGSGVNAHRDQDVRAGLADLADLAERTGVAVLAVRHLNKGNAANPLYRGGGSIGLIAAARSGLLVARDPDEPDDTDRRILASTKCNLARKPPALAFRVLASANGTLRIEWGGESGHDASTLLEHTDSEERSAREDAADFLRVELAEDPQPVKELKERATGLGLSWRTVERAKRNLGVLAEKSGFNGPWIWRLPEDRQGGWRTSKNARVADLEESQAPQGFSPNGRPEDRQSTGMADLDAQDHPAELFLPENTSALEGST